MRRLIVPSLLVLLAVAGCGRKKTYSTRDVERTFSNHGLHLIKVRSQPVQMLMTRRSNQHVTVLIYPNHRAAAAAVRSEKGRGVFAAFDIPKPANVGGILVWLKRNIVAVDVGPNISKRTNVTRARTTPGFSEAVAGLP
jgi:hypothetical protein